MSRGLLSKMFQGHVFDAMVLERQMNALHVPFDSILQSNSVEAALLGAVEKAERVALSGHSGCGKTSVARYVLDPAPNGIAPIFVPLAYEEQAIITQPKAFAQYLVDVMTKVADRAGQLPRGLRDDVLRSATKDQQVPVIATKRGGGISVPAWLLAGNLARDVTRTAGGGSLPRSEQEMLELANTVVGVIESHDLFPVLVMDDTDRLIGHHQADDVIPAFFGRTLRAVVDHLRVGLVIAVQPHYRARADYKEHASGLIERHIDIPVLGQSDQLARILERRIAGIDPSGSTAEAFTDDALDLLFARYQQMKDPSLRKVLACAHAALTHAEQSVTDRIEASHVLAGADDAMLD